MTDPLRKVILNLSVDPMVFVTGEGVVLEGNDAFCQLICLRRQALKGRPLAESTGVQESEVRVLLNQCSRTSDILPQALDMRNSQHHMVRYRVRCAVLERGKTYHSTIFWLKIRSRHQATEAFQRLNQQIAALKAEVIKANGPNWSCLKRKSDCLKPNKQDVQEPSSGTSERARTSGHPSLFRLFALRDVDMDANHFEGRASGIVTGTGAILG